MSRAVAIIGVGIDVVDIARFERVARAHARRCASGCSRRPRRALPLASLAARFAAKEALAKALGAPGRHGLARRRGGHRRRPADPRFAHPRHRCAPAPTSSGVAQRPPLAVPRRRHRLGRRGPRVLSAARPPDASRRSAASTSRCSGCSSSGAVGVVLLGRSQRGTPRARTFGRVLAVAIACVDGAEPGAPADARRLQPRLVAAAAAVRPRLDDGGLGAVDPRPGCRSR